MTFSSVERKNFGSRSPCGVELCVFEAYLMHMLHYVMIIRPANAAFQSSFLDMLRDSVRVRSTEALTSVLPFMTRLGEQIKNLRLEKRWKQAEAADKCELSQSVLSRIESGEITTPTAETMQKLANGFGVPYEDISKFAVANGQAGPSELRVGFAHSIWAAPVIPLAMDGPMPVGIRLTSYGYETGSEFHHKPYWYDSRPKEKLRVGPTLTGAETEMHWPSYETWPAEDQLTTYSAADLDRLLKSGEIDCVVAAKNVFESHDALLIRCARILDCVGGSAALLVWKEQWEWAKDLEGTTPSLLDISEILDRAASGKKETPLSTFYPTGTNAEKGLEFFPQHLSQNSKPIGISLNNWDRVATDLKTTLETEHAFLFLCWEPFLSYARAIFGASSVRSVTAIHLSARAPVPYLSFDLFFTREKAKDWFASRSVRTFLSRVELNINNIKRAISGNIEKAEITPVVRQIASYLSMSPKDCVRSLSEIDFGLLYYPDWLELAEWTQR